MTSSSPLLSGFAELDAISRLIAEARDRLHAHQSIEHVLHTSVEYRSRRARDAAFGIIAPDLFGEPAWDILLDLSIANAMNRHISVSSACIASAVPPTTALRYLAILERHGLISRYADPHDRRRAYVRLTPVAEAAFERWKVQGAPAAE